MEQISMKILISMSVLCVITGYSIPSGDVENINTFIETSVPLKSQYLGSGRDKIIAYSTDIKHLAVHLSHDSGLTFKNKLDQFLINQVPANLHEIYVSRDGQVVIFADIFHDVLFVSTNFGEDFILKSVDFKPSLIQFYGNENQFVVFDEQRKTLHFTKDGGSKFSMIKNNVLSFEWQTKDGLNQNLFLQQKSSSVYVFNGDSQTVTEWNMLSEMGYRQFQVVEDFVFVLTNLNQIYIIFKNEPPTKAEFYPNFACEGFHVAAIEKNSIKLAVVHKSETRLYVGNYRKNVELIEFVISLKNIVSHIPKITWNSTLIRVNKPFTDLYSVDGLTGVYIANIHHLRRYSKLNHFSITDITTVITLDNGVTWKPFDAHFYDNAENFVDCTTLCRLKLDSKLFDSIGFHHYEKIKSSKNVLGLIISSGIGQSPNEPPSTRPYNFLSNDMGKTWQKILDGYYSINIGNHGGIIVAVKSQEATKEILYSLNYGGNWNAYIFYDRAIKILDVFTSDAFNSTKFQLVGYDGFFRRQMFVTLDFKNIFIDDCTSNSISNSKIKQKVFDKIIVLEQMFDRNCLNFKPIPNIETAPCEVSDYECDYGYFRTHLTSNICYPHNMIECKAHSVFTAGKLRKIEGNKCLEEKSLKPEKHSCPIIDKENFILVASDTMVRQLLLSNQTISLLVHANSTVRAIDFDTHTKCLFYSEFDPGQIKRKCEDSLESEVLVPEADTWFKSLSYDDVNEVLYYLDAHKKTVFAVQTNKLNWGRHIRINNLNLQEPHFIYVNPKEQIIYIREGKQIKRGKIIHVNGEISVQGFVLETLPFELKTGDAFTLQEKNKQISVTDWYSHKNGNIFHNTYSREILGTGFTNIYDMIFVNVNNKKSSFKQWSCKYGEKITLDMVCDGNFDCLHGDDESSCEIRYQPDKFYSSQLVQ